MLKFLSVLLFCLLAVSAAEGEKPAKVLRLGGLFDLSSSAGAQWGVTERNAVQLAIDDFEKANPGVKVELKVEDAAYSNEKSVTALHKLSSFDGLKYFIGPTWEVFSAVMPICESRRLVCVAPSFNNAAFDNPNLRYSFTLWFDDRGYAAAHAEKINSGAYRKVAVFGAVSSYYDALVDAFIAGLKIKPVMVQRVAPEEQNLRSLISKVPQGVDAVAVFLLGGGQAQSFWKQWGELRKDRPDFFADDGAVVYLDPPLDLKRLGYSIYYTVPHFEGDGMEKFEADYLAAHGQRPAAFSGAVAYDSAMLLLGCMQRDAENSTAVSDCLAATRNYHGRSGTVSFSNLHRVEGRQMKVLRY